MTHFVTQPSSLCVLLCRTSTVRPCCCWLCQRSRSVWTWSSDPPSSCVTRLSVLRLPFTDSTPTEQQATSHPSDPVPVPVWRNVVVRTWEMMDQLPPRWKIFFLWVSKFQEGNFFFGLVIFEKHKPSDNRRTFLHEDLKDTRLGYFLSKDLMQ